MTILEDEAWESLPRWLKAYGRKNFVLKYNENHDPKNGQFTSGGKSGMDVDKAVVHLNAKAKDKYDPKDPHCARHVRQAIAAGGVSISNT